MNLIRPLAVTLALGLGAVEAHAANILVVLSDENHLDLKDGKVFQTGFYLNELMQPVKAFLDAGQRDRAIGSGLAGSEQVEIGSVQDVDGDHRRR